MNNKMYRLLVLATLILCLTHPVQSKTGKTYEDLEEIIRNSNTQGVRDFDAEMHAKETTQTTSTITTAPAAKSTPPTYSSNDVY